ncbi:hypothetical protein DUI87_01333 [Hirundo rustica rustica]|uniref:Core shell protein Gag P30 domain-containing protein n=1 Tax=Hirundo rustica rustica TaxID=333673 RepID=A0A3M0L5A0_HIRRU|nr:hypothetical protein DUI87_01333 [Hirundo rustica rustica]
MPAVVTTGQSTTHFPEPPSKRSAKLTGYMAVMDHISEGFSEQISLQKRLQLTEGLHLKDDNWNFVSVDNSEQGTWPRVKGKLIVVGDCKHTPKEIEILPGTLDNNPGKFVLWLRCTHPPTFLPKGQTVAQIIPTWEHLEEDNIPTACPVHNITEVKPQVGWFELQEDKVQRMPPWRYLGLEIGKRTIVPQKLEIKAKIQTLADVHQLCGALNWHELRQISQPFVQKYLLARVQINYPFGGGNSISSMLFSTDDVATFISEPDFCIIRKGVLQVWMAGIGCFDSLELQTSSTVTGKIHSTTYRIDKAQQGKTSNKKPNKIQAIEREMNQELSRNHPEWQRDCGMRSPSDPLVLALEKDNKATKGKPKRCCSTCSINQRCTHPDKVYQAEALEQETEDILKPPPRRQERRRVVGDTNSEPSLTPTSPTSSLASSSFGRTATEVGVTPPIPEPRKPPKFYPPLPSSDSEWDEPEPLPPGPKIPSRGPIASRTRKQTREVIQAPLRQAITSDGETKLIKVPFSSIDLEIWERIAKGYQSNPIGVAKKMKFMIKQHSPDWADLQLLLDALTETEKQLVLKVAGDLAEDDCRTTQEDVKDVFPLQDPGWDPNDDEGLGL